MRALLILLVAMTVSVAASDAGAGPEEPMQPLSDGSEHENSLMIAVVLLLLFVIVSFALAKYGP